MSWPGAPRMRRARCDGIGIGASEEAQCGAVADRQGVEVELEREGDDW